MKDCIEAILFDLGNVLIDVDFGRCIYYWSDRAAIPAQTLVARFQTNDAYRNFECGRIGAADYFAALRRQLGINLPNETLREGWNSIIGEEKNGLRTCVENLSRRYPLYILTNTNPEHEKVWRAKHDELLRFFSGIFVSFRMGCRKPDIDIYHSTARAIGQSCPRILFFDDTVENVLGARRCGMHAVHAANAETVALAVASLSSRLC